MLCTFLWRAGNSQKHRRCKLSVEYSAGRPWRNNESRSTVFRKFTLLSVLGILGAMLGAAPVSASARSTAEPGLTQAPIKPLRRPFVTPSPTEVEFGAVDVDGSGSRQI